MSVGQEDTELQAFLCCGCGISWLTLHFEESCLALHPLAKLFLRLSSSLQRCVEECRMSTIDWHLLDCLTWFCLFKAFVSYTALWGSGQVLLEIIVVLRCLVRRGNSLDFLLEYAIDSRVENPRLATCLRCIKIPRWVWNQVQRWQCCQIRRLIRLTGLQPLMQVCLVDGDGRFPSLELFDKIVRCSCGIPCHFLLSTSLWQIELRWRGHSLR